MPLVNNLALGDALLSGFDIQSLRSPWLNLKFSCSAITPIYGGGERSGQLSEKGPRSPSIKGQLRAWWRLLNIDCFGPDHAGCLIFHDALWVPSSTQGPLCFDILAPHHGDYYIQQGKVPATDFDVPVPVPQLGVQADFWFVFSCKHAGWRSIVKDLFLRALSEHGVGSKTSLGNGIFKLDSGLYKQQVEAEKAESLAVNRTFKVTGNRNKLIALNAEVDGVVHKNLEVDLESAQRFVDSLGKSQKKKVSEKSLEVTAKIRESGGRFMLFDLELPAGQSPENS